MSSETATMKKKPQPTLTPRLRFPEFRDEGKWVSGRCGDIAKVLQGYGFPERHQGLLKGIYPFYKVSDISSAVEHGDKHLTKANNYINDDVLKEIGARLIPMGTTIFAKIGEAIRSNRRVMTNTPCLVDNNVAGVKAILGKSSDEFLFYIWSNISLIDYAGGVVPAISKSAIETIPIVYTHNSAEQQKIADCLSSLDALIAAEGRKLAALQAHKKGLMQQLFPQPGQTQPRLRFPEFRDKGEWAECKLGALVDISSGKSPSQCVLSSEGIYPFVKVEDLNNCTKYQANSREYCDDAGGVVPKGSILFPKRGAAIELNKIRMTAVEILIDTNLMAITPRDSATSEFLLCYLSRVGLSQIADTSTIPQINNKHIIPFNISAPLRSEQQKIADCLAALDTQITAQASKIESLKEHKRGLMQQLFPAPEEN